MSSSSSASSRVVNRRSVNRVPTRCRCGMNLVTYVSKTNENPFRRFYRCEVALQRKMEEYLFKWIDETLLDETRMVEAKHMSLVQDVKELRKELVENLEKQSKMIRKMEEDVKEVIDEKMKEEIIKAKETMQKMADGKMEEEIIKAKETMQKMAREMATTCMQKVGITMLLVGTI